MPPEKEKKKGPAPGEAVEQQDQSIKARKSQLFEADRDESAGTLKPFTVYLRETPAAPMSQGVKVALWALAALVVLLFLGALLSGGRRRVPARGGAETRREARAFLSVRSVNTNAPGSLA